MPIVTHRGRARREEKDSVKMKRQTQEVMVSDIGRETEGETEGETMIQTEDYHGIPPREQSCG